MFKNKKIKVYHAIFATICVVLLFASTVFGSPSTMTAQLDGAAGLDKISHLTSTGALIAIVLYMVFDFIIKVRKQNDINEKIGIIMGMLEKSKQIDLDHEKNEASAKNRITRLEETVLIGDKSVTTDLVLLKSQLDVILKSMNGLQNTAAEVQNRVHRLETVLVNHIKKAAKDELDII